MTDFNLISPDATAQTELKQNLETQEATLALSTACGSAPEPVDPDAARISSLKLHQVRAAINIGEYYWQKKQSFPKLKDFKVWLEQQGFTWKDACRHIKLYETFAAFPLDQIGWLSLETLHSLCQPKYKELLLQLRSLPQWWDNKVQDLMQAVRKAQKPSPIPKTDTLSAATNQLSRLSFPSSGWKRMPSGGGRYYFVALHNDELGTLIQEYAEKKNWLPSKVIEEAVFSFCDGCGYNKYVSVRLDKSRE